MLYMAMKPLSSYRLSAIGYYLGVTGVSKQEKNLSSGNSCRYSAVYA